MRPLLVTLAAAALLTAVVAYGPTLPFLDDEPAEAPAADAAETPRADAARAVDAAPEAPGPAPLAPEGEGAAAAAVASAAAPAAGASTSGDVAEAPPLADLGPLPADGVAYVRGRVRSSLYATLAGALSHEVAEPLTQVVKRVLVWWIDPRRDLRPGDEVEVLYSLPQGEEPVVHAVRFRSGKYEKTFQAFAFRPQGSEWARLYDETGREVEKRLVDGPIDIYEQITSLVNDGRHHQGVDFKGPVGTPVKAPFDATVSRRNWNTRGNGNCLDLSGPGGVDALFLHLDGIEDGVRPGTRVRKGQVIARLGNTGRSTAPHLHYQLQQSGSGRVLDPFKHHRSIQRTLEAGQLTAFEAERDRLAGRMDREKARDDEA